MGHPYVDRIREKTVNVVQLYGFRTPKEEAAHKVRLVNGWPHISPNSIYIAPIGINWSKGCWKRVIDMVVYTSDQGINCCAEEIAVRSRWPSVNVQEMRDTAVRHARDGGFEWLCLLDNDVKPDPDILLKLQSHSLPIMAPRIVEPNGDPIGVPPLPANCGVQAMKWTSLSFLLIRSTVFNCPDTAFVTAPSEGTFFQQLWRYGHRPYVDTTVTLQLAEPPGRPSAKTWKENQAQMERQYNEYGRRHPDRSAGEPNNPYEIDGMYVPYLFPRNGAKSE